MIYSAHRRLAGPVLFLLGGFFAAPLFANAGTNLIQNPTFAIQGATTSPMNWIPVFWGAAASSTFAYPVSGEDDNFAAQVTVPTYGAVGEGNGSAEWLPGRVLINPGALYTFSDWYKSDAESYVAVQWLLNDGTFLTESVATLAPTGGQWANDMQIFSAPENAIAVTPIHFIQSAGTFAIDNVSLAEGANAFPGALNKAIVSLTFDNGYESQYLNAFPILQSAHLPATFYIITNTIKNSIYDFFTDPNEAIKTATTSTSAAWSQIYTDSKVQALIFSDTYTSDGTSTIEADYTINSAASSTILGTLAAGTNARALFTFTLPIVASSTVTPISIMHRSSSALTASNPSLIENIPQQMSVPQLQALWAAGNEIASHTVTHSDLTALSTAQVSQELANSRAALASWGIVPDDGLAYPFGNYSAGIETQTAGAGYIDARTVDIGYNTALTDKFALKSQSLVSSTTFSVAQSWIDTAIANKLWLIITFHDVDNQATINANGETYGTTPQILQQIADYLKSQSSNVSVLSVHDALGHLSTTTDATSTPPADTTPPVITLNGSPTITLTVGDAYTEPGATATDTVDSTDAVVISGDAVNTAVPGIYVVKYDATDAAGNHAVEVTRTVTVVAATSSVTTGGGGGSSSGGGSIGGGGGSILAGSSGSPNPYPWEIHDAASTTPEAVPVISKHIKPHTGYVLGAATFKFSKHLALRSHGTDVTELQKFLIEEGFRIPSGASGYFGAQTKAAVIAYQKANGLPHTGYVGPLTLALLNKGSGLALGK
ncbi:MAG: polysaccharide deacetylase family protein [Minisyncoccia bacterium]